MRLWRELTFRGRVFLLGGAASSALAVGFDQRDVAWITVFIALLPIIALAVNRATRIAMLAGRRVSPERTEVGRQTSALLDLDMRSRFIPVLLEFSDTIDPALGVSPRFESHRVLGPWRRRVTYELLTHVRGIFTIGPLAVQSTDPFGLTRVVRTFQTRSEVVVLPRIHQLPGIRVGGGAGMSGEETPRSLGASGHDDVLVRELRHDDDVRRVHWRSTAKYGELMVRREEQSIDPAVTLLLDSRSSAYDGALDRDDFEWAVSTVASFANRLIGQGYRVTILDADGARVTPRHDDASANLEEMLLAMTTQQLSARPSLDHVLTNHGASIRNQTLIALLGEARQDDVARLVAGTAGSVLLMGTTNRDEDVRTFAARRWRVVSRTPGTSVPQAWSQLGGLT